MSRFHPWTRFEFISSFALALFMLSGIAGLVAVWIGLALAPAAVSAVSTESAAQLFLWEAILITAAIALALAARGMVVSEWMHIVGAIKSPQVKSLHSWVTGSGLLAAWGSLLVPAYTSALLAVSSWMSLVIIGLIYGSVRGLTSGHAAFTEYRSARKTAGRSPLGPLPWGFSGMAFVSVAVGAISVVALEPIITKSRAAIMSPIVSQLDVVRQQISYSAEDLPIAERLWTERIAAETASVDQAMRGVKRGVVSEKEATEARQRLLQAHAESLRALGEARQTLSRLRRDEVELDTRLRQAQSAAPALNK